MKDMRKILLLLLLLSSGSGVCLQAQEVKAPEKDVKRANLWARQYVDKVSHQMVPYLEKSADFDAIPRDIERAAQRFYPRDPEMARWFTDYVIFVLMNKPYEELGDSIASRRAARAIREWLEELLNE